VHDFGGSFGAIFPFAEREPGYQLWTVFPADTPYFGFRFRLSARVPLLPQRSSRRFVPSSRLRISR
jgi:hypothetical protein